MMLKNIEKQDFDELIDAEVLSILRREKSHQYNFYLISNNGKFYVAERNNDSEIYMIQAQEIAKTNKIGLMKMNAENFVKCISAFFCMHKAEKLKIK